MESSARKRENSGQYVRADWGIESSGTRNARKGSRTGSGTVRADWGIESSGTRNAHKGSRTGSQTVRADWGIENSGKRNAKRGQGERERRRRARAKKKRQQRLFLLTQTAILTLTVCLAVVVVSRIKELRADGGITAFGAQSGTADDAQSADAVSDSMTDYADLCGVWEVATPEKRETWEAVEKLGEYAASSETIASILEDTSRYPDEMLEALANNPEMADFVAGYPAADEAVTGGLNDREKQEAHPLFLQWDPRWGYASYGDGSNIGLAGCGPTSLAMALFYLNRDENVTPDVIAKYSMENGYYMTGTGTAWLLMEDVPGNYGVSVEKPGISGEIMRAELDAGHVLICAMREGDFTSSGHFIVIYGYDENGFYVNDPNCVARSRQSWSYETLGTQIKQLWSLGKA